MNITSRSAYPLMGAVLAALLTGCTSSNTDDSGSDTDSGTDTDTADGPVPTVLSTVPLDEGVDQRLNVGVQATFSGEMDPLSLTSTSFVVQSGTPAVNLEGTVIYAGTTATFWPSELLEPATVYTAVLSTDALSVGGRGLAEDYMWTFTTGTELAPGLPVNLGTAGDYAILAKSGVSSVPASAIIGDVGLSPAAATYITGFSLSADATNVFSTSPQVIGKIYASDYAVPTPANLTTAVGDMERAYRDTAGRAPNVTELGAGNIGGLTIEPGVYKWGTGLLIPTDVTLSGSGTEVWIFQVAQDLTVSSGTKVILAGGAAPENVFWQVAGAVEVGTTAHIEGAVLTQTAINLRTGASINGRLLAQTAVDVDGATVTIP